MSLLGANYPANAVTVTPDTTYGDRNEPKFQTTAIISASEISVIRANGANSVLLVRGTAGTSSDRYTAVFAQGTPASYAAQSEQHVELTDLDNDTFYLNADLFKSVQDTSGGNSILSYGWSTGVNQTVEVQGTAAVISAAFAATAGGGGVSVITVNAGDTVTSPLYTLMLTCSGAAGTVTLPDAIPGKVIYIFNDTGVDFTIDGLGGDDIDGSPSIKIDGDNGNLVLACYTATRWRSAVTQVGSGAGLKVTDIVGINNSAIKFLNTPSVNVDTLFSPQSEEVNGAATPGTVLAKSFVEVKVNALNHGVAVDNGTYFAIINNGANPCFIWNGGVAIGAVPLASGDIATCYKIDGVWYRTDATPV